jgi:uncharacterized protein YkwD
MLRFLCPARLLFVVAFGSGVCCGQAPAQSTPVSSSSVKATADDRAALEKETFSLVNQYRAKCKLSPLQWDDGMAKVARGHSRDMAAGDVDFGHDGFGDRVSELKTRMTGLKGAGENVLRTDDPDQVQVAQRAVAVWLKSPHHLENIRGDYNYSGLGVWRDDNGTIYFTQIFVKIVPPVQAAQSPPPGLETPFGLLAAPRTR